MCTRLQFVVLCFSLFLASILQAEELVEDECNCFQPHSIEQVKEVVLGDWRPGLPLTIGEEPAYDPVNNLEHVRAVYNYVGSYGFWRSENYFIGTQNCYYYQKMSAAEYQKVSNEVQSLWALHENRTGPHVRRFSQFQAMFEYAESWVDFHYRTTNIVYKDQAYVRYYDKFLQDNLKSKKQYFAEIDQDRQFVIRAFEQLHEQCLTKHCSLRTLYEHAFLCSSQGSTLRAMQATNELIERSKKHGSSKYLTRDTYLQLGMQCALAHEFSQAIEALTQAIEKDPANKEIYLERAACYFEMGNFDLAVRDYIASGVEASLIPVTAQEVSYYDFGQGMCAGSMNGMREGAKSIPGTLLQSVHGAGHLLWACAQDPIGAPRNLVMAAIEVIECIRAHDLEAIAHLLVPEICELVRDWDRLESCVRGEKMGFILGKYGVEIFSCSFVTRLANVAQKLKRVNLACNFKAITKSANNKTTILAQAQITARRREHYLQNKSYHYQKLQAEKAAGKVDGITKTKLSEVSLQNQAIRRECYFNSIRMHSDSQGKHMEGHRNYKNLPPDERVKKSLLTIDQVKAEEILKQHAGKGKRKRGTPCEPGYQEVIDCGEVIGSHAWGTDGSEIQTQYATIHYRKNGYAHIVPVSPALWKD